MALGSSFTVLPWPLSRLDEAWTHQSPIQNGSANDRRRVGGEVSMARDARHFGRLIAAGRKILAHLGIRHGKFRTSLDIPSLADVEIVHQSSQSNSAGAQFID
jgi:hypothetical protein